MKKIKFKVDGHTLTGTIIYPSNIKDSNPAVLFVHGWLSSETGYIPRAKAVSARGAICMTFNLRGHGTSEGEVNTFSRKDHLGDVMVAYDYLAAQPNVDTERIGVVGASYGAYLSSILTSKRKVKWLVLRAPALYKDKDFSVPTQSLIKEDVCVYRQVKIKPQDNYALKALTTFKNNVFLIECENDIVVSHQIIKNYKTALKNKKFSYFLLPKADHELSTEEYKKAFIEVLSEIFKQWLK
jgi:dipeptidyl aminopeptidase/acylaminoacyl peptidase